MTLAGCILKSREAETTIGITGVGLTGVVRLTWIRDNVASVLDHSHADETSGSGRHYASLPGWPRSDR
jgi:hypothetical protein